ncbi:MAG: hypothetical protein LAQ69_32750 [Acidobacteriia bacterium]|nr:hypothetical protein [Terriglobia bacterium]
MQTLWTNRLTRFGLAAGLIVCLAPGELGLTALAQNSPGTGIRINVIQGEGQALVAGSSSPFDVVIEVVDAGGKPVANVNISFLIGSGGSTVDGLSSLVETTNLQGRATARIRPNSQLGSWNVRVTASYQQQRATASVTLNNVSELPVQPQPQPGPSEKESPPVRPVTPAATNPQKKGSSKTALIVLLVAAGVGGGAAAALAGKKGSSTPTPTTTVPPSSISLGITLGSGSFGNPPPH